MTLLRIALLLLLAYALVVALLWYMQPRMLFLPDRNVTLTPATIGLEFENLTVATEDGETVHGWFIPGPAGAAVTVLFCHGNAGNISQRLQTIEMLHASGASVLIFDYRGYGQSTGAPTERGLYLDGDAALRWLTHDRQIPPEQIVIMGRSLGGGVASHLASTGAPGGLILESTFRSVSEMAAELYPWLPARTLTRFRFDTESRMSSIKVPILVLHSPDDDVIPFAHGQRLFELAAQPKRFFEMNGGHNEGFVLSGEPYARALKQFIDEVASRQQQ